MDPKDARIASLEEEALQNARKFEEWKTKAKTSVDKHREQIISLTSELAQCRTVISTLEALRARGFSWAIQYLQSSLDMSLAQGEIYCMAKTQMADADTAALRNQLAENSIQFEKYKKRAEQTLRLSSKDHQGIAEESSKLKEALEQALGQLGESREAVNQRNIAISVLEKQLDDVNSVVDSLHGQLERVQQSACRDGVKVLTEDDLEKVRQEFGEREAIIFEQHRDELLRLSSAHEAEMEQARQEEAERLATAVAQARNGSSLHHLRDEAYDALLAENDAARASLTTLTAENALLRDQLAKLQQRGDGGSVPLSNATPAQLQKRIHELEKHVAHLSDQLWTVNHTALEAKAAKDDPSSMQQQPRARPDAQQQSYFRSVLVKLLCARTDDVKSSLMPVLTTIAQLDSNDLRQIYGANPGWIK
jgi:hypothetical protein